jgi:ABC-type transport system substrate-binding protein
MQLSRLTPLLLAVAVTGCSGTPFGDQLSRSFSQPPAAPAAPPAKPAATPAKPDVAATPKPEPPKPEPKPAPAAQPLTPAPYRVTIKLPAADPSSPAEAVTDALRQAGVAFEVETIERVPAAGADAAAPLRTTPAPPAR